MNDASVRDLATLQGLSTEFLAKLFTKLHKSGLVEATEGAKGGFRLARPADEITVLDVVLAIDGPKPLFDCREVRSRCAIFEDHAPGWATKGVCSIHAVMLEADKRMQEALAKQTLADLAVRIIAKAPPGYGRDIANWMQSRKALSR